MSVLNALKMVGSALFALEVTEGVIEMTESGEPREDQEAQEEEAPRTIVEEIEVEITALVDRIKELIKEGNVRTLRIKDPKGKYLFEVPLTVGMLAGGIFALAAPTAAAIASIAGFVTRVTIEIVREDDGTAGDTDEDLPAVEK